MANATAQLRNLAREARSALQVDSDDDFTADTLVNSTSRIFRRPATDIYEQFQQLLGDNEVIRVNRDRIVRDMVQQYQNQSLLGQRLIVNFIGETGQDAGGLTKDLFSCFWENAYRQYFADEKCFIPYLPVHRFGDLPVFQILGRILTHGTCLTGTIPIRIARSSIFSIIYGTPCDNEDILLEDLLLYFTDYERHVTKTALQNYNSLSARQIQHLTDMFVRFGLNVLPSPSTFKQNIINLARSEIAVKPLFLCNEMRRGIPEVHMEVFWSTFSLQDLKDMYSSLQPSAERVIDKLRTESDDLPQNEETTLYYLKDFIFSLSADDLNLFLQYLTGSDVLPRDDITVVFNQRTGFERVPVAHTCGNTLELPTTYSSIYEFKREFLSILHQQEAFQMSMA